MKFGNEVILSIVDRMGMKFGNEAITQHSADSSRSTVLDYNTLTQEYD